MNFDAPSRQAYDRDLTFELMTLFAEEGAEVFFVDFYGRDKMFNSPDPSNPTKQIEGDVRTVNFNGYDVVVNREQLHHHHFHVKFPDPYGPDRNANVNMVVVGHENDNPLTLPKNTTVTIRTEIIRDERNWALISETTIGVSAKNSAGEPRGVLDSTCTQLTGYRQCSINSEGSLQFDYTTSSASSDPVTISILTKDGITVLGTLTINIQ